MGFRSTFTTEDYDIEWPQWFKTKYADVIRFTDSGQGALHSIKAYISWAALPNDIQQAIDWRNFNLPFVLVYLHECGGITRCQIEKDAIKWSEPDVWRTTEGVEHGYHCACCCSDA